MAPEEFEEGGHGPSHNRQARDRLGLDMDLYEELLGLVDLLGAKRIDYALCGGIAVAFHGHPRFTKDIDILIRPEDLDRVTEAVATLGFDLESGTLPFGADGPDAREVHRIIKTVGPDGIALDLLLVSPALEDAWVSRGVFEWRGREVRVVSREGLAMMKRLAGRDQDLLDLKRLESDDDTTEAER